MIDPKTIQAFEEIEGNNLKKIDWTPEMDEVILAYWEKAETQIKFAKLFTKMFRPASACTLKKRYDLLKEA